MPVRFLPGHGPGPRSRRSNGGIIVSVGPSRVRWVPYGESRERRTPLHLMRLDPPHLPETMLRHRAPAWLTWNLARHLEYAAAARSADGRERLVVVPCGSRKAVPADDSQRITQAGAMYTGSYHRAARRAAHALTGGGRRGRVMILSAKYGLLELDQWISPYDLRVGDTGAITGGMLRRQARDLCVEDADVTVLAGRAYVQLARAAFPDAAAPLAGTRGIGDQVARLSRIAAADDPHAAVRGLTGTDPAPAPAVGTSPPMPNPAATKAGVTPLPRYAPRPVPPSPIRPDAQRATRPPRPFRYRTAGAALISICRPDPQCSSTRRAQPPGHPGGRQT